VIFADILTSYAKVLGDIYISFQMFLRSGKSTEVEAHWVGDWFAPCIMSIPYAIRFRQCILDYAHSDRSEITQLFNAAKYLTSFPVIFLSVMQRSFQQNTAIVNSNVWFGEYLIFRLWLLGIAINSLYSFWWDVTNDWGLEFLASSSSRNPRRSGSMSPPRTLILPSRHSRSPSTSPHSSHTSSPTRASSSVQPLINATAINTHPFGLRSTLLYPLPYYPLIIFLNLILRLTWSVKLSSHLHSHAEGSVLIFWLEMAEMVRRWMWVFLRVEWEVVRKMREGRNLQQLSGDEEEELELVAPAEGGFDVR